jgi:nitrous oxidase accessory protein
MRKLTASGVCFKESARVMVSNNEIAHSNIGLLANSPLDPQNKMTVQGNLFAYNVLGIYFYGEKGGHLIKNNRFENNFTDAMGSAPRTIRYNGWGGNQWDRYQGFDQDGDGVGDRSHDVYLFAEHLWANKPMSRFFRGSLVMSLLDFASRLAPFSAPVLEYSDPLPAMHNP